MDMFNKKKLSDPAGTLQPDAAAAPPQQPSTAAQDLAEARHAAEEQIRQMEARIQEQRDALSQQVRSRDEEGVSLQAQLEMLVRRGEEERRKNDSRLGLLAQQVQHDLAAAEQRLTDELRSWSERTAAKDREIEESKHQALFVETQNKIEQEQQRRTAQEEIARLEMTARALERQLLEEQNEWLLKIKSRDEEILNMKTQIALRETQLADDEQKAHAAQKEAAASWRRQREELEAKLVTQQEEWTKTYAAKSNELAALKAAMEQRAAAAAVDEAKRSQEFRALSDRMQEKMKLTEAHIAEDRARWQEMLSGRDTEFTELKARVLLQESQEKAEREKKCQEFRDAEAAANRKIADIRQKVAAEKENWLQQIAAKEEELKVARIQSELKLRELHDALERRTSHTQQEKEALELRVQELRQKLEAEKASWKQELENKNQELLNYQKEWQARQDAQARDEERVLAELKEQKENLERGLAALEADFAAEQAQWQTAVAEKTAAVEAARKSQLLRESMAQQELDALDQELQREHEPLTRQIDEMNARITELQNRSRAEISRRESQRTIVEHQFRAREEYLKKRCHEQQERLQAATQVIAQRISELKTRGEAEALEHQAKLSQLTTEKTALDAKLATLNEAFDRQKEELTAANAGRKEQLAAAVSRLENDYTILVENVTAEQDARDRELIEQQTLYKDKEDNLQAELTAQERLLADTKTRGDEELAFINTQAENARTRHYQQLQEAEAAVTALQIALREKEVRGAQDLEELRSINQRELQPLLQRRQAIEQQIAWQSRNHTEKMRSAAQSIEDLTKRQAEAAARFTATFAELQQKLTQAKEDIRARFTALTEQRAREEAAHAQALQERTATGKEVEQQVAAMEERFRQEKEAERQHAVQEAERLRQEITDRESEIGRIEREYPLLLSARQEEIGALEKQLQQRAAYYEQQQQQAERSLANYQSRTERRMALYQQQLEQLRERSKTELARAEISLSSIRAEKDARKSTLQEELARYGKIFVEEKYRLEKQKTELEEQLKDIQFRSREQLRQKEKEILSLQGQLADKEAQWDKTWKQKEADLAQEKAVLTESLEALNAQVRTEEETARQRLTEKEQEIAATQAQYAARVQTLTSELAEKRRSWDDANERLNAQIRDLHTAYEQTRAQWENERAAKDKELSMLTSNLEFWEVRAREEEEKRAAAWAAERKALEAEVQAAADRRDALERDSSAALAEKNRALQAVHESATAEDVSRQAAWKAEELRLIEQREALAAAIVTAEKKLKDETAAIETARRAADKELERLKFEGALKDTTLLGQRQKAERSCKKLQQELAAQLAELRRSYTDQKETWARQLADKDAEISTLKTRVTLRAERQQNEIHRRQDEIRKALFELETELTMLQNKYEKNVPARAKELAAQQQELAALADEVREKEAAWQRMQESGSAAVSADEARQAAGIEELARQLAEERGRLESLLKEKESYIATLHQALAAKDTGMTQEREHTLALLALLRQKTAAFRKTVRQHAAAGAAASPAAQALDDALAQFHAGAYATAVNHLEAVLKTNPEFAGAYQYLALCYWHLGDAAQSKKMAERALELEPHNEALKTWIEFIGNK